MEIDKLFKLLVVGGGLLTAGTSSANEDLEQVLADDPIVAFCNPDDTRMCVENDEGEIVVREGFTCCWGTSCN